AVGEAGGAVVGAAPALGAVAPTRPEAETERADLPLVGLVVTPPADAPPVVAPRPAANVPPMVGATPALEARLAAALLAVEPHPAVGAPPAPPVVAAILPVEGARGRRPRRIRQPSNQCLSMQTGTWSSMGSPFS